MYFKGKGCAFTSIKKKPNVMNQCWLQIRSLLKKLLRKRHLILQQQKHVDLWKDNYPFMKCANDFMIVKLIFLQLQD